MTIAPGSLLGVTGASGRIGRRFCEEAIRRGYRVRAFGRSGAGVPDAQHVIVDLASNLDPQFFEGCDAAIHLAAYTPVDHRSVSEGRRCWEVNVLGTVRLVQALAKARVGHLVQSCGANAYAPESGRTDEDAPLFPLSRTFYLGSKIAQELCAGEECRLLGVTLTTLRLSSVYGPDPSYLVAKLASRMLAGQPIELADEGRFGADLVPIDDIVEAILLVLQTGRAGPLNVASGVRTTLAELVNQLSELTGKRADIRPLPPRDVPDPGFPAIDIGRLVELGFHPTDLQRALGSVVTALQTKPLERF